MNTLDTKRLHLISWLKTIVEEGGWEATVLEKECAHRRRNGAAAAAAPEGLCSRANRYPLHFLLSSWRWQLCCHARDQDDTLLASLREKATYITDRHTYKQANCDFTPRHTHVSLRSRLTTLWKTPSPYGHNSSSAPPTSPSFSSHANLYPPSKALTTPLSPHTSLSRSPHGSSQYHP
jgi:hypothetical protein